MIIRASRLKEFRKINVSFVYAMKERDRNRAFNIWRTDNHTVFIISLYVQKELDFPIKIHVAYARVLSFKPMLSEIKQFEQT